MKTLVFLTLNGQLSAVTVNRCFGAKLLIEDGLVWPDRAHGISLAFLVERGIVGARLCRMPNWLTGELRLMLAMYAGNTKAAIAELLPRHSVDAIRTARRRALGSIETEQQRRLRWMRICHEHYARREAGELR